MKKSDQKGKWKSMDAKNKLMEWRMHRHGSKVMQTKTSLELAKNSKNKCNFFFLNNKSNRVGYNRRCRSFELWYQNDTGWESTKTKTKTDQRFKNSDWTDRTVGYGRLDGCDGEGSGRSGSWNRWVIFLWVFLWI